MFVPPIDSSCLEDKHSRYLLRVLSSSGIFPRLRKASAEQQDGVNQNGLPQHGGPRMPEAKWEFASIPGLLAVTSLQEGSPSSFRLFVGWRRKARKCPQMPDLETVNTSMSRKLLFLFAEQKPAKMQHHSFWKGIYCWGEVTL